MKKKLMFIIPVILVIIIGIIVGILLCKKPKTNIALDENITSTIIIDINPSIKLELNKDNIVIKMTALNEDAKEFIDNDSKGKKLENVLTDLTQKLKEKELTKDNLDILYNISGAITKEETNKIIESTLQKENITHNLIYQEISETSKALAEKYNISESKAAYIEEIIKENPNLDIEKIKDMSITEINKENKNNETTTTTTVKTTTTTKKQVSVTAPSDPEDTSGAWCTFRKNLPRTAVYNYERDMGMNKAQTVALNALNNISFKTASSTPTEDKRSSYCRSYKVRITTDDYIYVLYVDSVNGKIIEKNVTEQAKPTITSEQALQKGLAYFNLDANTCQAKEAYLSENLGKLRYTFTARCNETNYYTLHIDAFTGAISDARTW